MQVNNGFNPRPPKKNRWLTVLVVIFFTVFVFTGVLLGSNYQHIGNLVKVVSLIRGHYIEAAPTTTLVDGAMRGMVEALDDPYSIYLEPDTYKQLQEQIRGSFGGLGILVGIKDDYLTVARVFADTPAHDRGVKAGDRIIKIDGKDVQGTDLETAVGLMRGPVGSEVKLVIERDEQASPIAIDLVREEISVPSVEGEMLPDSAIGYITIAQFHEKTPGELLEVLDDLLDKKMQGLILDVRDNPGGELTAATRVADNFIPSGPAVFIEYGTGKTDVIEAGEDYLELPLVVLVNEGSASAAEILAGAIKDTGVGTLVGTKTFGKGVVQTLFPLDNGAGLKLTTARYLTPGRHDIEKKGITPDVVVEFKLDAGQDLQLNSAVQLIEEKM